MTYPLLGRIQAPGDVKRLQESELPALCEEIRQFLIESVSATGGHLSSNLGVVELTVALHRALDLPQDKILFDVGHQCYTHKLLTGRMAGFAELRQKKQNDSGNNCNHISGSCKSTISIYHKTKHEMTSLLLLIFV